MAIKNRQCLTCGTKFSYCPDCSRADALKPSWSSEFCSESCMTIWTTLTKFGMNRLTKSEAKNIISALDIKPVETYVPCVQRDLAVVMAEEKKIRKTKKKAVIEQSEVIHEVVSQKNKAL